MLQQFIVDHKYRAGFEVGLFLFILLCFRYYRTIRGAIKSPQLYWIVISVSLICTLTYILMTILILFYPNYVNEFELTVAIMSWRGTHGHPIYSGLPTGDIFLLPYGPLLFITNGAVLHVFPTTFGSKLAGWTAFVVALAASYLALKARTSTNRTVILYLMIIVLVFSFFHNTEHAFWSRPEPFLILISTLTVIAALKLPKPAAAMTVGILAGLAVNFKLYGAVYAMPAALAVFGSTETWRNRVYLAILSFVLASVTAAVPFLFYLASGGSLYAGYLSVILLLANQNLSFYLLKSNVAFIAMLCSPIIAVWYFNRPVLVSFDTWFLSGLFLSLALTAIFGSKIGAGPHHLLPLVPIAVYGLMSILDDGRLRSERELNARELGIMVLIPLLAFFAPGEMRWAMSFIGNQYLASDKEQEKISELQAFYKRHPLAEVGVSDEGHKGDTFYRALLVFQGARLHVDPFAWVDLQAAGVPEGRIFALVDHCDVPVWILPEGPPFTTDYPWFSDDFRRKFFAKYALVERGKYYNVWQCRIG